MTRRPAFAADGTLVAPAAAGDVGPDGAGLARALREGRTTARALATAALDRIAALNPRHNAVVSPRAPDAVLAEADRADEALARGERVGALHGLPLAIKDAAATAGLTTTYGSPLFAANVPEADDLAVARLRRAGAIVVGKTNVPEFGLGSHTVNLVFGPTRNAFAPDRSAGGSSGGAAVALALGLLPIADGSDLGGSLRNPAAWNNVLGFRPSQGRVPNAPGGDPFYGQLATVGPLGRSVADLALLLSVMAGPDDRAPLALASAFPPQAPAPTAHAPRIAWLGDLEGTLPCEPGVLDLCEVALGELRAAGWVVETPRLGFDWAALWASFVALRQFMILTRYGPVLAAPEARARVGAPMLWELAGAERLTASALAEAARVRGAWYAAVLPWLARFDALALPTSQVFPFPVEWDWPRSIAGREMDTYHRWMEVSAPGTLAGLPVASVPAGFDARGLPMGIQLLGRPRDDAGLLALVARYVQDAARAAP